MDEKIKEQASTFVKPSRFTATLCDRCFAVSSRVFEDMYKTGLRWLCVTCLNDIEQKGDNACK